jgi:hypothetical protein
MNRREILKAAWPALLKLAEKNHKVTIYYRGINEKEEPMYEMPGFLNSPLTEAELLTRLGEGSQGRAE